MRTIFSLILPINATWRYLKGNRKGLGFVDSKLKTRASDGTELFVPEVPSYANATAANTAEDAQVLYYNVATGKFMVTTA